MQWFLRSPFSSTRLSKPLVLRQAFHTRVLSSLAASLLSDGAMPVSLTHAVSTYISRIGWQCKKEGVVEPPLSSLPRVVLALCGAKRNADYRETHWQRIKRHVADRMTRGVFLRVRKVIFRGDAKFMFCWTTCGKIPKKKNPKALRLYLYRLLCIMQVSRKVFHCSCVTA